MAVLHGSDPTAKAILMLAHVDVVEAKREDWTRDPFTLIEEDGYFYGRGTSDMKAQAAIWVDNLVRFREEGFQPRRTIKLALTCGEETSGALNGAQWLAENDRDGIDAAFALNEGVDGDLDARGQRVALGVQAAEKISQNYTLEVTNPGGHSSRPVPDNAIYHLAAALQRLSRYEFPGAAERRQPRLPSGHVPDHRRGARRGHGAPWPRTRRTRRRWHSWTRTTNLHAMLRTTCVATLLAAGHATNALPQRAAGQHQLPHLPGRDRARRCRRRLVTDRRRSAGVTVTIPQVRGAARAARRRSPRRCCSRSRAWRARLWPGVPGGPGARARAPRTRSS